MLGSLDVVWTSLQHGGPRGPSKGQLTLITSPKVISLHIIAVTGLQDPSQWASVTF